MLAEDGVSTFEIEPALTGILGRGFGTKVRIDGKEVSQYITNLTLRMSYDAATTLTLEMIGDSAVKRGEGIVEWVVFVHPFGNGRGPTPLAALRDLLAHAEEEEDRWPGRQGERA